MVDSRLRDARKQIESYWVECQPLAIYDPAEFDELPAVLRRLLLNRGLTTRQEADIYLQREGSLYDPFLLKGMQPAVNRLWQAIDSNEKIAIYGDYDADGVTATALMVLALERFGADVAPYIPNRFDEGYGLNAEAVEALAQRGVKLIVTVDCGIRSPDEVSLAQSLGVDVVVSDHHTPREVLPPAVAVVCHKQPGDTYPEKDLAGVGLAYKIIQAMLLAKGKPVSLADEWLDLVALGSIADVVPLRGENRAIVKAGLRRIHLGQNTGIRALCGVSGTQPATVNSGDIGFRLAPRLNAAGRIDSAMDALHLLLARSVEEASLIAQRLDDQNKIRQQMTTEIQDAALAPGNLRMSNHLIFSVGQDFNKGVVGLAAGKLTEAFYRPAIVGSQDEDGIRASCRSIAEFDIVRALDECADLLVQHGGHAAAAGFTVKSENLDALMERLQRIAERELGHLQLAPTLGYDMEVTFEDLLPRRDHLGMTIRPTVLEQIAQIEPRGANNDEAVFVSRNLTARNVRLIGSEKQHMKFTAIDGRTPMDVVGFHKAHLMELTSGTFDLLYTYETNTYNGRESLQLNMKDLKRSSQ